MHILMDKGLKMQDIWPGQLPKTGSPRPDEIESLPFHLAFWQEIYPTKEAVVSTVSVGGTSDPDYWSALGIISNSPSSQYDMLRQSWLPQAEKLGPVAWLALSGDGFHGQRQRSWAALPGNLHLSVGIQPHLPAAQYSYAMTMLPAVCLMDILVSFDLDKTGIKWVNDVLVGRQKLAGVLTSARTEKGMITGSVLGFGLNIASAPQLPRSSFVQGSTCLHDHLGAETPSLGHVVTQLLQTVARRLLELQNRGPGPLFEAYLSHSLILGQHVTIWPEDAGGEVGERSGEKPLRQGIVQAINPDLGLVLEGQSEPVSHGRLVWKDETTTK